MSSVITYLFFGVLWDIILHFIGTILESESKLNNWERVFSILAWPLTLIIFIYHFIKTFFQR
jgi:hypothetical protein